MPPLLFPMPYRARRRRVPVRTWLLAGLLAALGSSSQAQDWPAVYEPGLLLNLNLEIDPADWDAILRDGPADPTAEWDYTEYPAMFWADGEEPILVAVRRKRSRALPSEADPQKVGLKIDIDEYLTTQKWHELTKLSLENGGEGEIVREGLSWVLHGRADYGSGLGNWVTVTVNGEYNGVFASAEQVNKRALKNRDIHFPDQTWLYKHAFQLSVGGPAESPTVTALCYPPFNNGCATPPPDQLALELPTLIDMDVMLTMAAANAFVVNRDALFSKPNNYYFADWNNGLLRRYFPWDLDTVFADPTTSIRYIGPRAPTDYQTIILDNPTFGPQYDAILTALVQDPYSDQSLMNLMDLVELTITAALEADPNNGLGGVAAEMQAVRTWLCQRVDSVRAQLGISAPPACSAIELCTNGMDDDGDGQADCADADCADHTACLPEAYCFDGLDNDLDGAVDCDDPDCLLPCFPEGNCSNGIDDNGNGLVDCDDPTCAGDPACPELNCFDGVDNDLDGAVDCDDPDCAQPCNPESDCSNGLDDDADGAIDCLDPDCLSDPACAPEGDCANGLDDDGDGLVDCDDPDCVGEVGCLGESDCSNGVDDDGDGFVDCDDVNCVGDPACPEVDCANGADDDLDGLTDCADPDCLGDPACPETDCANGADDDGDGLTDCADSDCLGDPACPETDCANGADDDGDGLTDCADPDCLGDPACPETECANGADDDGDGLTDCADPDCLGDPACPETDCANGADDDGDGLTDCADDDCLGDPACPETDCANGADDDGDGQTDCADPDCLGDPACPETECANGADDDGDGLTDCADPDCLGDPACPETDCANGADDDGDGLTDCDDDDCLGDPACGDDRDGDGRADSEDCAPDDPTAFAVPARVVRLDVGKPAASPAGGRIVWNELKTDAGTGTSYELLGGRVFELHADAGFDRIACLAAPADELHDDLREIGSRGVFYYLVAGVNACGAGPVGRSPLDDGNPRCP